MKKRRLENEPIELTPEEFEIAVKNIFAAKKQKLTDFKVDHLKSVEGMDGDYEIDVLVTFEFLGEAEIKCLIECKHYRTRPVDRDKVMILNQKLQSTGSHKGMIISSNKFQRGAIEFAQKHGISLVKLAHNEMTYYAKARIVDALEVLLDEDDEIAFDVICEGNAITEKSHFDNIDIDFLTLLSKRNVID